MSALDRWHDSLVLEVCEYQTCHNCDELLGMFTTAMRHAFLHFTIAPMTRRQMTKNVPDFQCFCLDIRAYLDYHNIFLPRLAAPNNETAAIPVSHDVMGAVTHDDTTVMELYKMRIPVWHIRPTYKLLPHMNIRRVTHLSTPRNMVTQHYRPDYFPTICSQGPGTICLQATQQMGASCINLFKDISTIPNPPTAEYAPGANPAPRMSFFATLIC